MKNQGYVIVRYSNSDQYFTASSSYDRAVWTRITEATVYHSSEKAHEAAKKLWLKGNFGAKVMPLSETRGGIMSDIEAADAADAKSQMAGAVSNIGAAETEDEEAMDIEFSTEPTVSCCQKEPVSTMPDLVRQLSPQQGDALAGAEDEEKCGAEDGEVAYGLMRFVKGTPVLYKGGKFSVVQDSGTGVVSIVPADSPTATPVKVKSQQLQKIDRVEDHIGEAFTMPRAGDDPATPDENDATIPNLKDPKVREIMLKDPVGTEHRPETDIDYSTDRPHEETVKVPSEVLSAIRDRKAEFERTVKLNDGFNDTKASFAMTVHDCLQELEDLLTNPTVENIKQAQIRLTSWMNPITTNIPEVVRNFIYRGGRQPSLKDLFDTKRGEKLEAEARKGFGAVKESVLNVKGSILNVKTLTPKQIAAHHSVSVDQIEKQLAMGIKVEQEHTTDKRIAREIALDHLKEDPKYYTKLKKMERKRS